MSKKLVRVNDTTTTEQKSLTVRLPFITQTIALILVPFEELLSFQFGSILRIINLLTILLVFSVGRPRTLKVKKSTICLLLFLVLSASSYLWCFNTGLYLDRLLTYGLYSVLILMLGSLTPTLKEKETMLKGLYVGGLVASVLLLVPNTSLWVGDRTMLTMFGRIVNSNRLSLSFVISANYSTYKLFYCKGKSGFSRMFWILSDALLVVGILISGSRSAFIVLLICVFFLAWKRDWGYNSKSTKILFVAFILLIMYILYSEVIVGSELGDRFTFDNLIGKGKYGLANRNKIWAAAITKIKERPLLGYGNGASPYAIAELYKFYSTHNSYLMILLELGIVGFMICSAMFISLYKEYKRQNNQLYCSFIVCVLVDFVFIEGFTSKVFWAVMVLLMGCQENVGKNLNGKR